MERIGVAAAPVECAHFARLFGSLRLAEEAGWHSLIFGLAIPLEDFLVSARQRRAKLPGSSIA